MSSHSNLEEISKEEFDNEDLDSEDELLENESALMGSDENNINVSISWSTNLSLCYHSGHGIKTKSNVDVMKMVITGFIVAMITFLMAKGLFWINKWFS